MTELVLGHGILFYVQLSNHRIGDPWALTCTLWSQTASRSSHIWQTLPWKLNSVRNEKPWESPLLTLKENLSLPRLGWLLISCYYMSSMSLPIEHPPKLNIKKCPYISIVPMCFENAYLHNIFSYFIFLTGCSSIYICCAGMFLTILPEAYGFHEQLLISFIIHFKFFLHKCKKESSWRKECLRI